MISHAEIGNCFNRLRPRRVLLPFSRATERFLWSPLNQAAFALGGQVQRSQLCPLQICHFEVRGSLTTQIRRILNLTGKTLRKSNFAAQIEILKKCF